ncbi:MAG TPA: M1 family aminopeptidase/hydrolase, partial [Daejeonella sp.]
MKKLLILIPVLFVIACRQKAPVETKNVIRGSKDAHSFARPSEAIVKHLDLDIKVDFENKLISGKASWLIDNLSKGNQIVFDTRNLEIRRVTLGDDETETTYSLGNDNKFMGRSLNIKIAAGTSKVNIYYTNSADAAAVQWLNPQQTAGKKYPFMFTQSQAILARTWIPCQDSPGIRFTYNATVAVPQELLAVMSANNPQAKNSKGVYTFSQKQAIPSYLMALAVGDIAFKAVDHRTGVYAEPVTLQKAAYELADMGKMTNAAEKIYGPYKWGRYDVLILPPSFPFGGMENPMLTFATPTIIAGDRSLVSLIAHELAHSWSGNLVTNATWNDFWLNEGFTTYFERRIVEDVYGKDEARMQELLGYQGLQELVKEMGAKNEDTKLKANFDGRDPDEGVSDIAYEKGYSFLRTIEEAVGRKKFDSFLRSYFDSHAFNSVTTEEFLAYLDSNLI